MVLVPSAEKANEMILQDMLQVSLAEKRGREEQEARENVALVYKHLAAEEIEKLFEDPENVNDSSPPRHDDTSIPGTRLEPRSDKESPEVEIVQEKEEETTKDTDVELDKDTSMVDVTNIVTPVNVDDEEDEISDEVFELKRWVKRKNVEETRISPILSPTRSPRNLSTLGRYGYLFAHLKKRFMPRTSSDQLANNLLNVMMETLPSCEESNGEVRRKSSGKSSYDAHPEGENSAKRAEDIREFVPSPWVRDSKYFMEQMLLAKQDEAGVILTDEHNDFLFADASRMEEIEELTNIQFDSVKGNVNSGSVEKDTHVYDQCALETLARNAYDEAAKQQRFAQKVQQQNMTLTSQIEMYKERNRSIRASMFYTSKEEIALNDFCRDQVKPLLNELLDYFDGFQNLFQKDIKEIKDAFEQNDVYLDEIERQNDLLKDQLLEASLKHDIELCVLLNHECVDKSLHDELEQVKKKSLEIQEGLKARIKILEKDVQRCEKQSVDFELKLQHEKEKQKWDSSKNKNSKPLDFSWISRIQKLEDENVSLDFKVQSLIKERDNAKMEYKKLFDSIKKTRSQTQKEMDELIAHVSEKTYAYGAIRAENQNLLVTISELKARMKNGENGKSVNTKFDKTHGSQSFICVTPLNKNAFQKQTVVLKTKENHVESKPVTLQTSHTKQTGTHQNTNVISPGMYRVVTQQESQTNKSKNVLSSTGMNATSSVKRPKSRDSHVKTSVLDVSKNEAKKEAVYVRKNKQTDNTFANVVSNKDNVIDVAAANASKAKTLLCVSCMKSVLIPCHDKCVAKHKLNVRSNARRTFSVNSRIPKSFETTFVAPKTRFSEKATQSKTLDTTSVASKSKIDEASASKARDKVSSEFKKKKSNMRDKPLSPFMLNKIRTSSLWQKWFESQPNVMWTPVNTKPHAHTNPSNTKPLVSVKRWIVKLPSCPCVVSSCVADETPEIIKKFIAQAQLNYKAKVCKIRTDNGTEFKNATLKAYYEKLGIMQQFSIVRTPQQNGVVERRNRTLVEAARTMLIFSRLPEFLG
ncbi:retrovirus-related pol polyprotein from transposon TNT 1-94 [Tanacetum coccineum]